MRKKRDPESEEQRTARAERQARQRSEQAAAEERTLDADVRRSIKLYGA